MIGSSGSVDVDLVVDDVAGMRDPLAAAQELVVDRVAERVAHAAVMAGEPDAAAHRGAEIERFRPSRSSTWCRSARSATGRGSPDRRTPPSRSRPARRTLPRSASRASSRRTDPDHARPSRPKRSSPCACHFPLNRSVRSAGPAVIIAGRSTLAFELHAPALVRRSLERLHRLERMQRERAARAMRPVRHDRGRHVGDADRAELAVGIAVRVRRPAPTRRRSWRPRPRRRSGSGPAP